MQFDSFMENQTEAKGIPIRKGIPRCSVRSGFFTIIFSVQGNVFFFIFERYLFTCLNCY